MIRGTDDLRRVARLHDVAAAIIPNDLRLDAHAGTVGRGIHMRTEATDRNLIVRIRRDGRVDVAVFIEMGVADSHCLQLGCEQAAQVFLLLSGGAGLRRRVRLGVDHHIAQEALGHGVGEPDGHSQNRTDAENLSAEEASSRGAAYAARNDAKSSLAKSSPGKGVLSDGFLELLGGAEGNLLAGLDVDRLAGGGVAAHAGSALAHLQDAKTDDANALALLQMLGDPSDHVVENRLSLLLG